MPPGPSLAWPVRRCDARGPALNGSLTIIVLTPLTTCSRGRSGRINQVSVFVGVFLIVRAGPATGRSRRARVFRAALPCLALIALTGTAAQAQTVTPDLFSPTRASQVTSPDSPLRRTAAEANDPLNSPKLQDAQGQARAVADRPDPEIRPAGRERRRRFRLRLAQPQAQEAEILSRAGEAEAAGRSRQSTAADRVEHAAAAFDAAVGDRATRRRSPPAMAGTVVGQPPRKRLRIDDDPFGAVGDYAGSFLIKSAVELCGGYDTNPGAHVGAAGLAVLCGRAGIPRGLRLGAPRAGRRPARLLHRLQQQFSADVDGMASSAPVDIDRPDFIGHVDGRLDVSRDTRLLGAGAAARRHRQSRQPERAGRPRQISGLRHVRRHASASTRTSTACRFPPAPRSTAPSISTRS